MFDWSMAEIVNSQRIQKKLFAENCKVVGAKEEMMMEDDLMKIPYLKAVLLEGLRRHLLGHFTLPRSVVEETELQGYKVPKGCGVIFMLEELAKDPDVWEDPLEYKPERFLAEGEHQSLVNFDFNGSKEIKMVPFGIGRRICPVIGLAMHNLEYFVANLIWKFKRSPVDGDSVHLSEKMAIGLKLLKHPLKAYKSPRLRT